MTGREALEIAANMVHETDLSLYTATAEHTHDERYYTETEVNTLLAQKANTAHTHAQSDVTGLTEALNDAQPQIGDIKTTTRTNLGEKWLLCNGEGVDMNAYPALWNLLSSLMPKATSDETELHIDINCIRYVNNMWVACGGSGLVTNANGAWIAYADSLNGPWSYADLSILADDYYYTFTDINYLGGYWVASGHRQSQSYTTTPMYVYTQSFDVPLTRMLLPNSRGRRTLMNGIYVDGTYVFITNTNFSLSNSYCAAVYYTTDITQTPTEFNLEPSILGDNSPRIECTNIIYAAGVYATSGTLSSSGSGVKRIYVAYAPNPTGPWASTLLDVSGLSDSTAIQYLNNQFVITYQSVISSSLNQLCYADSITGTWTPVDIPVKHALLSFHDGLYVIFDGKSSYDSTVYYTENFGSEWKSRQCFTRNYETTCVFVNDNAIIYGFDYRPEDSTSGITQSFIAYAEGYPIEKQLPLISTDQSYAYIKAKE